MRSSPGVGGRVVAPSAALAALAAFLALPLLAARPARAQASDPELRPTRGPYITDGARAGDADATAVQLNPGALGFLPAAGLELVGAYASDPAVVPRRGLGAYLGLPILPAQLPRARPLAGHRRQRGGDRRAHHVAARLRAALPAQRLPRRLLGAHLGRLLRRRRHLRLRLLGAGRPLRRLRGDGRGRRRSRTRTPSARRCRGSGRRSWCCARSAPRGWRWRSAPRTPTPTTGIAWCRARGSPSRWSTAFVSTARGRTSRGGRARPSATAATRGSPSGWRSTSTTWARVVGVPIFIPATGSSGAGIAGRLHVDGERRPALVAPAYVARVRLEGIDDDRHFFQVVRRLRALAVDPAVAGVLFKIEGVNLGYARIEELRDLVALLRAHGKRTFGYLTFPSTREYYLAAACDVILDSPRGRAVGDRRRHQRHVLQRHDGPPRRPPGAGARRRVQGGDGAVRDDGAVAGGAREQEPAARRRLRPGDRRDRRRSHARRPPDGRDDRPRRSSTAASSRRATPCWRGSATPSPPKGIWRPFVQHALGRANLRLRDPDSSPPAPAAWPSRRVAVLFVDGTMVDGPNTELPFGLGAFAGSDTLGAALEQCRRDPTIAAVVLRVNSPGGSAFASDVLAREIKKVRAAGKPIVVSMGDLAASGGYYIAAPADVIYAEPSTTTGSIGVFGYKVDAQKLLGHAGDQRRDLSPGRARRLPVALPALDRRGARAGRAADRAPLPAVRGDGGRRAPHARAHRRAGRRARPRARLDRRAGAGVGAGRQDGRRLGGDRRGGAPGRRAGRARPAAGPGVAAGREQGPPAPAGGRGVGARKTRRSEAAPNRTSSRRKRTSHRARRGVAQPASLLTDDARAALRLLAPFLVQGNGSGFAARLPYDIDLR